PCFAFPISVRRTTMSPVADGGLLFDDISLRTVVMVCYSQAALRIQCLRFAGLLPRLETERLRHGARRASTLTSRGRSRTGCVIRGYRRTPLICAALLRQLARITC